MKLFMWSNFNSGIGQYTIYALASDEPQAKKLVIDKIKDLSIREKATKHLENHEFLSVIDAPEAFINDATAELSA